MAHSRDSQTRCLILACGNTLREDDGVGPWLAAWAEERFAGDGRVRVIARQQWTPELAIDLAQAEVVLFVDCSVVARPGDVKITRIEPKAASGHGLGTHHFGAPELLALGKELYDTMPRSSLLLTVGAGSLELREGFSEAVQYALPLACAGLEKAVLDALAALAH